MKKILNYKFSLLIIIFTLLFSPVLNTHAEDDNEEIKQEVERVREEQKQRLEREREQSKQEREDEQKDDREDEGEREYVAAPTIPTQPIIPVPVETTPAPIEETVTSQPTTKVVNKPVTQMVEEYQVNYITQYRKTNNYIVHDVNLNGIVDEFEILQTNR